MENQVPTEEFTDEAATDPDGRQRFGKQINVTLYSWK